VIEINTVPVISKFEEIKKLEVKKE